MVADILCACLTNLPSVITRKCFCNAIEKREQSVKLAARLLGETEAILNTLQQRELPPLDPNQEQWRYRIGLVGWERPLAIAKVLCSPDIDGLEPKALSEVSEDKILDEMLRDGKEASHSRLAGF
ncbi:hypothetical protein RJ640_029976 [Escallonia rubra]|uniref:Uncharacterized protein n=1 Tax=Escallonia rubra TaxID=112253 RepID=A0AA88R9I1_9ASTE|nr:hypothetical protein RJ640_029976 [Escallonia rubra]